MVHVVIHVALQDGVEWAKQAHEAVTIDCCDLDIRLSDNVRRTRLTL